MAAKQERSALEAFGMDIVVSGTAAGSVKTITAPIERVKLLIQTQDANPLIRSGEVPRYTGIANCFQRVHSEQGIKSFWRGNGANVLRYIPQQSFNLAFKDQLKRVFPKYSSETEFMKFFGIQLCSAGLGAAGSLTICYPLDFARTRLASDVGGGKKTFNGIGDCIMKTVRSSGIGGLYNGYGTSIGGAVAYRGVQLGCFDTINALNPYKKDLGVMGIACGFACGMSALLASLPLSYPFDTVRRRQQMESEKPLSERRYGNFFRACKVIIAEEGMAGMYKGVVANIFRGAGAAMVPVCYEKGKIALGM